MNTGETHRETFDVPMPPSCDICNEPFRKVKTESPAHVTTNGRILKKDGASRRLTLNRRASGLAPQEA